MSANTWSRKASLPVVLAQANQAVQLNGKIYVSGGFTRFRDPTREIWRLDMSKALYVYDIAKNTWTVKAELPEPGTNGVAAAYNGFIYVAMKCLHLCGNSQRGTLWRYNRSTDRWAQESRIPNGNTDLPQGGIIDGKFYVIDSDSKATDIYNLSTKVWTAGPPRPTLRCLATSTTFQAKVYVVNCGIGDGTGEAMFVLDPQANEWTQLPAAPAGVSGTLARVGVNGRNRLELIGGAKPGNNWQYTP